MAYHDDVGAVLLGVANDLFSGMPDGNLEPRLNSVIWRLRSEPRQDFLVVRRRCLDDRLGFHIVTDLGGAGDRKHIEIGTIFLCDVDRKRVALVCGLGPVSRDENALDHKDAPSSRGVNPGQEDEDRRSCATNTNAFELKSAKVSRKALFRSSSRVGTRRIYATRTGQHVGIISPG